MRHSPLDASHRSLGARMVPFGDWEMPIQYSGVLDEHRACRNAAAVFDVSHLGSVRVRGSGAAAVLQRGFTNDLNRIAVGRAQYTHLLDATDAHVVDDIIVWWVSETDFLVMPNASNTDALTAALDEIAVLNDNGVTIDDITATRVVLAVQGPTARDQLRAIDETLAIAGRFRVVATAWRGHEIVVAGTGYTGEDGVEIHIAADAGSELWDAIIGAGILPAGLGARDTLRLEAGLPLHGHELGPGITPLQAGLDWVVRFDKGEFIGRTALLAEQQKGIARRLRGVLANGRQPLREGCAVNQDGVSIGILTSGNISPILGRGIGLALVPPTTAMGEPVDIDVRGRSVPASIVALPFLSRS